jgi:hypothetical protein
MKKSRTKKNHSRRSLSLTTPSSKSRRRRSLSLTPSSKSRRQKSHRLFTMKQYNANDGMLTKIWGPPMWHFLHTMSFNYPVKPTPEQKQQYKEFLLALRFVLPCGKCRQNYTNNIAKYPAVAKHLKDRHSFSLYIYTLHEVVNKMLDKKSGLSYADVRERYEHFRARCLVAPKTNPNEKPAPPETGCVEPMYGTKSKCLLQIVPAMRKCNTLSIDRKCVDKCMTEQT